MQDYCALSRPSLCGRIDNSNTEKSPSKATLGQYTKECLKQSHLWASLRHGAGRHVLRLSAHAPLLISVVWRDREQPLR